MKTHGYSHFLATALCLLSCAFAPLSAAEPPAKQCLLVPGRSPHSNATWESFLGQAAHRIIAYSYGVENPGNQIFYNRETILRILDRTRQGDASRLLPGEANLCPDIADVDRASVFEIKPRTEARLQEGRQQVRAYLEALNRAVHPARTFRGGVNFRGEILIRFAQGEYIWRLQWETTEPGVIQYQWTRSQERFDSEVKAYEAGQWVGLSVEELKKYGGWVGQAVEGMVERRQALASFSGVVGIAIDVVGNIAVGAFSGVILGGMGSNPGAQQPPAGAGAKVLPFPQRAPPVVPPKAASGM